MKDQKLIKQRRGFSIMGFRDTIKSWNPLSRENSDSKGSAEALVTQEERQEAMSEMGDAGDETVDKIEMEEEALEDHTEVEIKELDKAAEIVKELVEIDKRRLTDDKEMYSALERAEKDLRDAYKHEEHLKKMFASETVDQLLGQSEQLEKDIVSVGDDLDDATEALTAFLNDIKDLEGNLDSEEHNLEAKLNELMDEIGRHLNDVKDLDEQMDQLLEKRIQDE